VKNIISFDEIPDYKATFLIGVLVGMGIFYKIEVESPMYRTLRERKRERYHTLKEARENKRADFNEKGYQVYISGENKDDIKVTVGGDIG